MRKYQILERAYTNEIRTVLKYVVQIYKPQTFFFDAKWVDISAEYPSLQDAEDSLKRLRELNKAKYGEIDERIIKIEEF